MSSYRRRFLLCSFKLTRTRLTFTFLSCTYTAEAIEGWAVGWVVSVCRPLHLCMVPTPPVSGAHSTCVWLPICLCVCVMSKSKSMPKYQININRINLINPTCLRLNDIGQVDAFRPSSIITNNRFISLS